MQNLFNDTDLDKSGFVDSTELAVMLKKYYKMEGTSRGLGKVQQEVDAAMTSFDNDGNGKLDFAEFIELFCSGMFKFRLDEQMMASIKEQAEQAICLKKIQDSVTTEQAASLVFLQGGCQGYAARKAAMAAVALDQGAAASSIQGIMRGNASRAETENMIKEEAGGTIAGAMNGLAARKEMNAFATVLEAMENATATPGVDSNRVKALVFLELFSNLNVEDRLQALAMSGTCKTRVAAKLEKPEDDEATGQVVEILVDTMDVVEPYLSAGLLGM